MISISHTIKIYSKLMTLPFLQCTWNTKQFRSVDSPFWAEQNGTNNFVIACMVVEIFVYNWSSNVKIKVTQMLLDVLTINWCIDYQLMYWLSIDVLTILWESNSKQWADHNWSTEQKWLGWLCTYRNTVTLTPPCVGHGVDPVTVILVCTCV